MTQGPLFVDTKERVSLSVRDLTVTLSHKNRKKGSADIEAADSKVIVNNINFDLKPGKVLAILGSSGSGKTTLLNTISSRLPIDGSSPFSLTSYVTVHPDKPKISYLLQEDSFVPGLSVFELLDYTGRLKLPETSKEERIELINFLLNSLGLMNVRDTIAMSFTGVITLSGGERRRVSLALQLLTKPTLLFLDEPTTGLDATTSQNLINTVKKLSIDFGITVILTIHQPRFEILEMIDEICLLAKGGSMLFYGSLEKGYDYFQGLETSILGSGFVNDESNFADFLLKISSVDKYTTIQVEQETQQRVQRLIQSWQNYEKGTLLDIGPYTADHSPIFAGLTKNKTSLHKECAVIFERTIVLTLRDFSSFVMLFFTTAILAVICGWVFLKPDSSLAGIRTMTSALYVCCEVVGYTPLMYEIQRLCFQDGKFMIQEYKQDHLYSLTSWFIGRRLAKFLIEDIPISMAWSVITFFMWGLKGNSNFGIYFINILLIYMVGMATAHMCFVCGNFQFPLCSLITGLFYQFQNSACGYFVNAATMPVYVRWTKYAATFWYSFGSLLSNQFSDFMGDCNGTFQECFEYSGIYNLDNLGFPQNWYTVPLIANIGWFLGFYISSALLIWFKLNKGGIKVVKERKFKIKSKNLDSFSKIEAEPITNDTTSMAPFSLVLQRCTLSLKKSLLSNTLLRRPFVEKTLLDNISLEFKPGLNAIMGPSGSGKTTLLNLITGRTNFSNLSIQGDLVLENNVIPYSYLSKLTSYVVQDDSYLIPTLTVRETLYYQAKLRLEEAKHQHIEHIVYKLVKRVGLLDVLDIPIGDYIRKGISGGEKRRLSIAIQLLNEGNKILLLDEPTSGLDSFTSQNIMDLLSEISYEFNKIIILTIHQPKFEIFQMFDQIVLLKSGELVYNGSSHDLIESISGFGHQTEKLDIAEDSNDTNFADYLMDVLIEDQHKEELGRIRALSKISTHQALISDFDPSKFTSYMQQRLSYWTTFPSIVRREFKIILRTEGVMVSRTGQFLLLGIIHALYFAPLRNNSDSISNRLGLIQEVLNLYFVGLFNNMALYPIERNTFYHEYKDNLYSVGQFMVSYFINEFPTEAISSFVLSCFIVLIIGLPRTPGMFFSMWYTCTLCVNCAESIGILFNTIFDHIGLAVNLLSNLLVVGIFMGGTMSLNMPVFFKAFNYVSPLKYSVLILAQLGLEGQTFTCLGDATNCALGTGEEVLDQYGLNSTMWVNYVALFAIFVIYRMVAYVSVRIKVRFR